MIDPGTVIPTPPSTTAAGAAAEAVGVAVAVPELVAEAVALLVPVAEAVPVLVPPGEVGAGREGATAGPVPVPTSGGVFPEHPRARPSIKRQAARMNARIIGPGYV